VDLILVRHAIAEERDPTRWPDDAQRPLSKLGRKRFGRGARGLGRLAGPMEVVLSSPYVRAWDTAMLLHKEAGWMVPLARDELTEGSAGTSMNLLREYAYADTLALVGHQPDLGRLLSLLLRQVNTEVEIKKGAAVCVRLHTLDPLHAELLWLLPPRALRLLA
jgi:phosphohistidine phosphatase